MKLEPRNSTLGLYAKVETKQLETPSEHGYMNGLLLINLKNDTVKDFRDDNGMFKVRYESMKPFNRRY